MTPTLAEVVPYSASAAATTVSSGAGTLATDTLLLVRCTEDDGNDNMATAPSGTGINAGSKIFEGGTSTETFIQLWTLTLASAGAKTLTVPYSATGTNCGFLCVLRGLHATPLDGTPGLYQSESNATSYPVPATAPAGADDLLFLACAHRGGSGSALTYPGLFTSRYNSGAAALGVATLSASGSTGAQTVTGPNDGATCVLFAIRGPSAASTAKKGQFSMLFPGGT